MITRAAYNAVNTYLVDIETRNETFVMRLKGDDVIQLLNNWDAGRAIPVEKDGIRWLAARTIVSIGSEQVFNDKAVL